MCNISLSHKTLCNSCKDRYEAVARQTTAVCATRRGGAERTRRYLPAKVRLKMVYSQTIGFRRTASGQPSARRRPPTTLHDNGSGLPCYRGAHRTRSAYHIHRKKPKKRRRCAALRKNQRLGFIIKTRQRFPKHFAAGKIFHICEANISPAKRISHSRSEYITAVADRLAGCEPDVICVSHTPQKTS